MEEGLAFLQKVKHNITIWQNNCTPKCSDPPFAWILYQQKHQWKSSAIPKSIFVVPWGLFSWMYTWQKWVAWHTCWKRRSNKDLPSCFRSQNEHEVQGIMWLVQRTDGGTSWVEFKSQSWYLLVRSPLECPSNASEPYLLFYKIVYYLLGWFFWI